MSWLARHFDLILNGIHSSLTFFWWLHVLWSATNSTWILSINLIFFQNDIKSAGRKPFYLHPPSNNSESGEEQTRTSNLHNNKPPLRRSGLPNYSSADERLKQYSAYELNRRPNKKKSSQSQISPDSSGSFFLHDPTSTLGYNRLSDLFPLNSAAQTVCSDDSGVGLTSQPPVKPLTRPRQKPPKPPGKKAHILKIEINNFCQ